MYWDDAFFLLLGLVVGSFLNVVLYRWGSVEKRFWQGRSQCMHCGSVLCWFELVPVVSYLLQRGKCRSCRAVVSPQYVVVEIIAALLFWGVYTHLAVFNGAFSVWWWALLVLHLVFFSLALVIAVHDARTTYIPDTLNLAVFCSALAGLIAQFFLGALDITGVLHHILAGAMLYVPFYVLWKVSGGRWIGLGDGKFAVSMGLLLGAWGGVSAVMYSFWLGAVVAMGALMLQRIAKRVGWKRAGTALGWGSEVPFGPFLVLGTGIVYFTNITILHITSVV